MTIKVPPPLITLLCTLPMVGIAHFWPEVEVRFAGQAATAITLAILGILLMIVAAVQFKKQSTTINPFSPKSTTSIVQSGVFKISRNPMYLGMLLILSGVACYLGNPVNLVVLIGFIFLITIVQIKPEETVLNEAFGEEYGTYLRKVRRWI